MSNDPQIQAEEILIAKWEAGEFEDEFVAYCIDERIHKDDWPDAEEDFLNMKFWELAQEFE